MNGCYYIKVISQMARIGGSLLLAILWACLLTSSNSWCYFNKFSTANDVFEASYSPDGQYIVVAINDKRNYVYETATYSAVFTYTLPTGWICYTAKFSPDQNFLAYGLQNSTVMIFDGNFNYVTKFGTAFQVSYEVHFSPNSDKLLVCGGNGGGSAVYGY
jgi:Tol biopolymer transport system component